jgi:hypothetical protein
MTTRTIDLTVAEIYRDRADELEEKAEKLASSEAAKRAEELFANGWEAWRVLNRVAHKSRLHVVRYSPEWPEGKRHDPQVFLDREGEEVVKYLRVLTNISDRGRHSTPNMPLP